LIVPLKQKNNINGILLLGERIDLGEGTEFSDYDKSQILNIASLASIAINNASLVEMTTTDMMTHLKLKHYFYKVLSDKLEISIMQELPLAVMMLDIDFFKRFNDTYGHACGDFVLQRVAKTISDGVRGNDLAGRYGGEEFVVMLFNTDQNAAMMVAERIRREIENLVLAYDENSLHVTISIGVSLFSPGSDVSAKQLVELADQALYLSKRNGRNRTTFADPELLAAANAVSVHE
jgi:diguanylate cyclase (GGDEF)-like protein